MGWQNGSWGLFTIVDQLVVFPGIPVKPGERVAPGGPPTIMSTYRVSSSGKVSAPASRVYAVIADYRAQHPRIVPPKYFRRLEVLEGGVGAGTRTRVEMCVWGKPRVFEQIVTEPEPGRVLMETNADGSAVTTFTVDQADGGQSSLVTIATEIPRLSGLAGILERCFASLLLSRIYRQEIALLAEYVSQPGARPASPGGRPEHQ
jgi:hypothetical protein